MKGSETCVDALGGLPMSLPEGFEADHLEAQGRMGQLNNYYRWILGNFRPYVGLRVWDAGAGVGHVSSQLVAEADFLLATEYGDENLRWLHYMFDAEKHVDVRFCDLLDDSAANFESMRLDTVINLDVLEHLEHAEVALRIFHRNLISGGCLLVKVPAHPFLYGTMDEASLHFRRYTKAGLRSILEEAGFIVERISYMNMAAVLPYFIKGRILRRQGNFSRTVSMSRLGFYNRMMPWFEWFERIVSPRFGLSLYAVARKL